MKVDVVSVYDIKPRFQALLSPLLRSLRSLGVTPNGLTLAALAASTLVGYLLWRGSGVGPQLLILPAWLFLRMALNALDGMMARQYSMASPLGAVLNELGDVLSDLALYLPLGLRLGAPMAATAFAIGAILTELCGLLSQALGAGRSYHGPMGKSDRAFACGLGAILLVIFPAGARWSEPVLWLLASLTLPTCILRLRAAARGASG